MCTAYLISPQVDCPSDSSSSWERLFIADEFSIENNIQACFFFLLLYTPLSLVAALETHCHIYVHYAVMLCIVGDGAPGTSQCFCLRTANRVLSFSRTISRSCPCRRQTCIKAQELQRSSEAENDGASPTCRCRRQTLGLSSELKRSTCISLIRCIHVHLHVLSLAGRVQTSQQIARVKMLS